MFNNKKIAFIGPGVMAEAMIAGLIRENVADPRVLQVSGPSSNRVKYLEECYAVNPFTDNRAVAQEAEVVVLSVKPQRLDRVLIDLRDAIRPTALILSIVAGASWQAAHMLLSLVLNAVSPS